MYITTAVHTHCHNSQKKSCIDCPAGRWQNEQKVCVNAVLAIFVFVHSSYPPMCTRLPSTSISIMCSKHPAKFPRNIGIVGQSLLLKQNPRRAKRTIIQQRSQRVVVHAQPGQDVKAATQVAIIARKNANLGGKKSWTAVLAWNNA